VCAARVDQPSLTPGGWVAAGGIGAAAIVLLGVSALGVPVGAPTCILGILAAGLVLIRTRSAPWPLLKGVSWSILPLVAGLFVLVEALDRTGLIGLVARLLAATIERSADGAALVAGAVVALTSNLINNLPAGLIAGASLVQAHAPERTADAVLIGVDLGPNLSVTGSLATILWLSAIRREGQDVGFWRFLRLGALIMPAALVPALAARLLSP